jgi:hypothetical protein
MEYSLKLLHEALAHERKRLSIFETNNDIKHIWETQSKINDILLQIENLTTQ